MKLVEKILLPTLVLGMLMVQGQVLARDITHELTQASATAWSNPVNLSQAGLSESPLIIVDNKGVMHVLWQDQLAGPAYARNDGESWSEPKYIYLPFDLSSVVLIPDADGKIHALWTATPTQSGLKPDELAQKTTLYYSYTTASHFPGGWVSSVWMVEGVQGFHATLGKNGYLYLAYVRSAMTSSLPAGIYAQRLYTSRSVWSIAKLIYSSAYLRSVRPDTARVDIEVGQHGEDEYLYLAWDNRPRNQVYFSRSIDNGLSWEEPLLVQAPNLSAALPKPYAAEVTANRNNVLLLWQEEGTDVTCSQYFKVSQDGGATWGPHQRMLLNTQGCPQGNRLYTYADQIILQTTILGQLNLTVWNGSQWSDLQPQTDLLNFKDPETNVKIDLQCQESYLYGDELLVVGCDAGSGGDIWLTERNVSNVNNWFSSSLVWSDAATVSTDLKNVTSVEMVPDTKGGVHAFWNQTEMTPTGNSSSSIQYGHWDSDHWTLATSILDSQPGKIRFLTAALDSRGRLLLFWIGGPSASIYFSWANASSARNGSEWTKPIALPIPTPGVSSLEVLLGSSGNIMVAYSIPLNESRGIYLIQSSDWGVTWSQPSQVFDGVQAEWEMVDDLHISATDNQHLHLIWTQYSLPDGDGPLALYYTQSTDGGKTWQQPQMVTRSAISWSAILSAGDQIVHRAWQEIKNGRPAISFEVSLDNGITWERVTNISLPEIINGMAQLHLDRNGNPHLLELGQTPTNHFVLYEWIWNGTGWISGESQQLGISITENAGFCATVTSQDKLAAIIYRQISNATSMQSQGEIIFTSRKMDFSQ